MGICPEVFVKSAPIASIDETSIIFISSGRVVRHYSLSLHQKKCHFSTKNHFFLPRFVTPLYLINRSNASNF